MTVIIDGTSGITTPAATVSGVTTATGGVVVGATAAPAFSAYQSSAQSVSSTLSKILFQTEEFDTNNNFASSTFTPTVSGYYMITASFYIGTSRTGLGLNIYKNGSNHRNIACDSNANMAGLGGSALVYANGTTDYFEIYGRADATQNTVPGAQATYFQAAMVRSA